MDADVADDRVRAQARCVPAESVILTCGNPSSMADIKHIADTNRIRYEKEDWKLVSPSKA